MRLLASSCAPTFINRMRSMDSLPCCWDSALYGLHRIRVASLRARERNLLLLVDQRTEELQQDVART